MDYRLSPKIFHTKRCVLRATLTTLSRDISYYNLADGLVAFDKFKQSWQNFNTAVSLELYEYGHLINGWSKQEGDYDVGKLSKSHAENANQLYTTAQMRQKMIKEATQFHITKIAESKSNISGKKQYALTLLFGQSVTYLNDVEKKVTVKVGDEKILSLDADDNRDDVFSPDGENFIGEDLPYGPCILVQKGKYYRIDDVEDEDVIMEGVVEDEDEEETDEEANENHVAAAVNAAKTKAKKSKV